MSSPLPDRTSTHGKYPVNARCFAALRDAILDNWQGPPPTAEQSYALTAICMKLSRISAGDSSEKDHWGGHRWVLQAGSG